MIVTSGTGSPRRWLTVVLIVLFSVLLPKTFPTVLNLRVILSDKSIIALLSLAAMIPMVAGRIDLTAGLASCCGIVLWHILAISLQVNYGCPGPWRWSSSSPLAR